MKKKANGPNAKVMKAMTDSAMPTKMPPPSLHLHGQHAKKFHGMKPGSKVSAHVRGTLKNVGFGYDNEPTAEMELTHVMPGMKGKGKAMPMHNDEKAEGE